MKDGHSREPEWPRVYIDDPYVRDAVRRALEGASSLLETPKCQSVLSEFVDEGGRPLTARLASLDLSLKEYMRVLVFMDGGAHRRCNQQGVLGFTTTGGRIIYVCGRAFERNWKRNAPEARATIIHELLHSLGLGENPPSPRYITDRVQQLCW